MAFEGHCRHRVDDALILCSQMGFKGVKSVRGDSRSDSLELQLGVTVPKVRSDKFADFDSK